MIHLFQTSNIKEFNYKKDNTLCLMLEGLNRGYEVWQYNVAELSYQKELFAKARRVKSINLNSPNFINFSEEKNFKLAEADAIHLRNDPPFDLNYLTNTYLLEMLENRVKMVNKPSIIRNFPEKISPLLFANFTPKTLISQNVQEVEIFRKDFQAIVIKPLYFFGGQFILKFNLRDKIKPSLIQKLVKKFNSPLVVQEFLPQVYDGDKRILLINGKVAGAILRRPKKGSFVANLMQGGSLDKTDISTKEMQIASKVGEFLKKHQIISCGIDIIGEKLTEINITSPIGYRELENMYGLNAKGLYWDAVLS